MKVNSDFTKSFNAIFRFSFNRRNVVGVISSLNISLAGVPGCRGGVQGLFRLVHTTWKTKQIKIKTISKTHLGVSGASRNLKDSKIIKLDGLAKLPSTSSVAHRWEHTSTYNVSPANVSLCKIWKSNPREGSSDRGLFSIPDREVNTFWP